MTRSHDTLVSDQFGVQAQDYVQSAVHAQGDDLDALEAIARRAGPDRALDLGAGGGHVSYRLADHARQVTAVDLSPAMLEAVAATAHLRGYANIATCQAAAERLPFEDAAFDMLVSRFSAHHWGNFEQGLREARRVLEPGATAVFIDVIAPADGACDSHLQTIELLRDPSHGRDYTLPEWVSALTRSGFRIRHAITRRLRMDYPSWVERMRTSPVHRAAIRSLQQGASQEVAAYFAIEQDGSFHVDTVQIEASAGHA
jgi:ubiquinone/menaquinone biosynthesis C-methylase UbiE